MLIIEDAGNLLNAARNGLLTMVDSPGIWANVPANRRDPAGQPVGLLLTASTVGFVFTYLVRSLAVGWSRASSRSRSPCG